MTVDIDSGPQAVGANGLTFVIGGDAPPAYLVVANNTINGSTSGTNVSITTSPPLNPTLIVPYGTVKHYYLSRLNWFKIVGNGANVSVMAGDHDIPLEVSNVTVNVPSNVNVTGTVATTGLTSTQFANGGVAPFAGKISVMMEGNGEAITLSINGGAALPISASVASGTVTVLEVVTTAGSTYTFAGGTFLSATISPLATS